MFLLNIHIQMFQGSHQILFNLLEVFFLCQTLLNINEENSQAVQISILLFQTYDVINKMTTRGRYFLYDVEKFFLLMTFFKIRKL